MDAHELIADYIDEMYPHDDYAVKIGKLKEHFLESINRELQSREMRVLDVCTGTGRALSAFVNDSAFDLTGIDISSKLIYRAKDNYNDVRFVVGNILKLANTFRGEQFDCILLCGVSLQLFAPEERHIIFSEVSKILRNTGSYYFDIFTKTLEEDTCFTKLKKDGIDENIEIDYRRVPSQPPEPWTQHVILRRKKISSESWDSLSESVSIYNVTVDAIIEEMEATGLRLTEFQFDKDDNTFFRMAVRDAED